MTYPTILVHLDPQVDCEARSRLAIEVATTGVTATDAERADANQAEPSELLALAPSGLSVDAALQAGLDQRATETEYIFEQLCREHGISRFETRRISDSARAAIAYQSLFSDIVVTGHATPQADPKGHTRALLEEILLASARPVLLAPAQLAPAWQPRQITIAWNPTRQAARACSDALPLLRRAQHVQIVSVQNGAAARSGDTDGGRIDLARYLSRHKVRPELVSLTLTESVGATLIRHCHARQTDLLVMGGYSKTRLRERLLGGTTRSILEDLAIPVMMTH